MTQHDEASGKPSAPLTFVDRGGTFTDVVRVHGGVVTVVKVPSDTARIGDLAEGRLTFGTTVATNALLEGHRAATLLFVTVGFEDLPLIGDMSRPALFDPDEAWNPPLCDRIVAVAGRIDHEGLELAPLVVPDTSLEGVSSIAIVLLNSHTNPAHELALAAQLAHTGLPISLGHRVSPELGYLARIETTLVDAAITPLLHAAMLRDRIPADALAVRSDGSLCPAADLRAPDAVLSGPASGVAAVAAIAKQGGFSSAVGLDMGGTSTDLCRVDVGELPRRTGDVRVAGVRLRRPMLEVDTIASGGGSVLWSDGLQLGVGPQSAGAHPGPQCYGRGGPPTLTDAALLTGRIDATAFEPALDLAAVALPDDPQAFLDVAHEAMASAVQRLAASKGADLSTHALVAYGGAAGQHAANVADRVGIQTVLFHPCAGVLCAYGQTLTRREEERVRALWRPLDAAFEDLPAAVAALLAELPVLGDTSVVVELRHLGTDHPIAVPWTETATLASLTEHYRVAHRARFGFNRASRALEVVNLRVRTLAARPELPTVHTDPWGIGDRTIAGPARVDATTTAIWVPAGWQARRADGLLRLARVQPPAPSAETVRSPARVALWSTRFMAVAEQAGAVLQRLARSVNIRERLDFSCALFDGSGRLIANAPHIPVHLGAMGETVRDLIASGAPLHPGQSWLCNDPNAGGSHLPDLTVTTVVFHDDQRFFVACRGHHADVGGSTPGSMPPHSTTLLEEGFVARHVPLLDDSGNLLPLTELLAQSRLPETVRADLEAQLASNTAAARALRELGQGQLIATWMDHLREVARQSVARLVATLPTGSASDTIDGVPLRVSLRKVDGRLLVDFTGTGGPHQGNLNAPPAVARAAVLYCLRVLADEPLPLNEGAFADVSVVLPGNSILSPGPDAAVAGGNVETSQRIVDLLLRAAGARAGSQGTMNNLTLGGPGWSFYETLGGGTGGSAKGPGSSARQVHMTNTRATDPEVMEARLPLRVRRFAIRRGSGGHGEQAGGDGLIREIELVTGGAAAMLATRRTEGAPGLGGDDGLPGRQFIARAGGATQRWAGEAITLAAGDRVRVETPGGGGFSSGT